MASIPNRSPLVEGVTWAMFAIALPPVLLRTWARATLMKKFGIDDWLMSFAMVNMPKFSALLDNKLTQVFHNQVSFTFNTVICFEGAVHGTGRHYWNLQPDSMATAFEVHSPTLYATGLIVDR